MVRFRQSVDEVVDDDGDGQETGKCRESSNHRNFPWGDVIGSFTLKSMRQNRAPLFPRHPAAAASAPFDMVEGLSRLFVRHVSSIHARQKDEISVLLRRPKDLPDSAIVPVASLDPSHQRTIQSIMRQDTSRKALRNVYTKRMRAFKEELSVLESPVIAKIQSMPEPSMVVGVEGNERVSISLSVQQPSTGRTQAPAQPRQTKKLLVSRLEFAISRALADLGFQSAQPFTPESALRIMSHVQFRPLVKHHLERAGGELREGGGSGTGSGTGSGGSGSGGSGSGSGSGSGTGSGSGSGSGGGGADKAAMPPRLKVKVQTG